MARLYDLRYDRWYRKGYDLEQTKLLLDLCRGGCKADIGHFDELLKHGADPNGRALNGWSPIHYASHHGNKPLVELLLSHQVDVDKTTDDWKKTALHKACERGHVEIAATLLKHGANVDKKDKHKETALYMAYASGHLEVAATLLKHGANVNKKDMTKLLLNLCRGGCKADIGRFDELLKHGADPNRRDRDGLYPIHHASRHSNKQLVELLLSHQADVNKTTHDRYKETALHKACERSHVEIAATLLKHGANVDKGDVTKLLHSLCYGGCKADIGCFDKLLKHGADPNGCGRNGWYPIHYASHHGNKQLVELLLSHQVDVNKTTYDGDKEIALHKACESGHVEVAATLLKHGAVNDLTELLLDLCRDGCKADIGRFDNLLNCGADPNGCKGSWYPIHHASRHGNKQLVELLLSHQVDVNKTTDDWYKETALHVASENGHVEVAATLLKHEANVDRKDKVGRTPLDLAKRKGHSGIVSLLEKGAHSVEKSQSEDDSKKPADDQLEREDVSEVTPSSPVPSGHILTESELQVLSRLLATYSNEKIKEIQQAIQRRLGRGVSRQEVERSLREVGMMTIADELEQNLQKGVENAEHYQAYQAALEGAITLPLRYLKFLFFGSPRSGKSTMRQRLLQEIINLTILGQPSVSTGVAEAYEIIIKIKKMTSETAAIAGSQWHSLKKSIERGATKENVVGIDIEYLTQIFYHLIFKTVASIPSPSPTSEAIPQPADSEASNGSDDPTPHDDGDVSVPDEPSLTQEKANQEEASVEVTSSCSYDSEMAEIDKSFDELASILQSESPEELYDLLKALTLINMSDVGGQPEFLDVIPALTVGAALYLLFFRLDQEVHKRYPVKYLAPGSAIERTLSSTYCIEEVLHQALASIACFSGHSSEESAYSAPSRAILVGTYKDQVTANDIAEKEKEIQEKFTSAEVYTRLLLKTKEGKPFFTVDNMNGTDESEMSEIRSNIENIVKAFFEEVPIPASWLMFRVMLHLLNKPIVSLSQCEEIARRLSMPTPVQEALWFFHHHVGSLLYYPDIPSMRGTVICTPQVIFDSISTVIIGNFQYSNYQVPHEAVEQFQQTGLFSLSDISEKTEEHRSSHLSSNQLVDVLKHQGILAEVKHDEEESSSEPAESKFIIPAVLKHASEEELKPSPSLQASPLMIRFEGGFVPFGVFSASAACFIAHADSMSPKWKLCEKEVRKNKVKFLVAGAYNVTLISRPRYLEIQLERYSQRARCKHSLPDICSAVRQTMVETLETTISKMQYRPQACVASVLLSTQRPFHLAFSCCVSESEPHSGHLMKVDKDEDGHYGVCLRDGAEVNLDKEHLYWFDKKKLEVPSQSEATATCKSNIASSTSDYDDVDSTTTLSERDIRAVMREIGTLVARYQQLGRELGVPAHELQKFQMHYGINVDQAFNDMVLLWLRGRAPRTWQALVRAVANPLGGNDDALAKKITAHHKARTGVTMNMSQGPPAP